MPNTNERSFNSRSRSLEILVQSSVMLIFRDCRGRAAILSPNPAPRYARAPEASIGRTTWPGCSTARSALVTGGGGGIGRATALVMVREGARVAVADFNAAAARDTVAQINAAGGQAITLTGDVTSAEAVQAMVKDTLSAYGRLDCAFNNAGIAGYQVDASGKKTAEWAEEVVRPHDRGQPEGRLALHARGDPPHAAAWRRRHRQHRLDRRAGRPADLLGLCRRQARRPRPDQDRRASSTPTTRSGSTRSAPATSRPR